MNIPKIILSGLLVCLCVCGWARPVSLKQALAQAEAFYELKTVSAPRNVRSLSAKPRFELSYVAYRKGKVAARRTVSAEEACFYVVNVNGNEGFVIVSGDDRARPILAYSLHGGFTPDALPANSQSWLQGYQEEISLLKDMPEDGAVMSMPH